MDIHTNNNGDRYEIINIAEKTKSGHKKYNIRFLDTGYEAVVWQQAIKTGDVRDRFKPSVFGVGYMGNATSKGNIKKYNLWHNMLIRCYNDKSKDYGSYGAIGVRVDERWHCFENFMNDLPAVEGYLEEAFNDNLLSFDKDKKQLSVPNSERIYSLETCCFISIEENCSYRNTEGYKREFIAISPSGEVVNVKGLLDFCKQHDLYPQNVGKCLKGLYKQYRGWRFKNL